jgi:imidazole glycerol-phosphate synthase subunit HisF
MLKKRLIPTLLLKNGQLVRSEHFEIHQVIGNPVHEVERFNQWSVDELIYIDISDDDSIDGRVDIKVPRESTPLGILEAVAARCFMPLTFGGRIRSVEDMRARISRGADKITLNSAALARPELITEGAEAFGSQAVVVVIDALARGTGHWEVMVEHGRRGTGWTPSEWAREAERRGAGEILLQAIDRDGTGGGYDLELIRSVTAVTSIPLIALGGVGSLEDFAKPIVEAGASAASAANFFHYVELSDRRAKRAMAKAGVDVRI